jgi:hypothetical protein
LYGLKIVLLAILGRKWHLFNQEGYPDELIFNNDYIDPLITMGWTSFKNRNNLPDDVECVVGYYTPHLYNLHMTNTSIRRDGKNKLEWFKSLP